MTRVSKPHRKLMFHTSYKWQASVFAAIKGQTVPKYADWLIRSHPVAINGLWMHVQSGYHSQDGLLFCVQFRRRRIRLWYQRATEQAAQIGFWLYTGRSVVGDDWPLCVWSVVIAGVSVIVPACTDGRSIGPAVWCYPKSRFADDDDALICSVGTACLRCWKYRITYWTAGRKQSEKRVGVTPSHGNSVNDTHIHTYTPCLRKKR